MLSMQAATEHSKEELMATIIVLNVVLAALVVGGILTLLGWGIAADRASISTFMRGRRASRRAIAEVPATRRQPRVPARAV